MAYCDIDDVRGLNPKRTYSATSTPTTTQVNSIITNIAAEIDVILTGRGLSVPVTTPAELLAFLKLVNATGAAAYAEGGMLPGASGPGGTPHSSGLWAKYRSMLKYLREGELPTGSNANINPFSFFEQNKANDTEPTEDYTWHDHKFKKNMEF